VYRIAIFNDQHLFSGTSNYIYSIYRNLRNHNVDTEFYQFLISDNKVEIPISHTKYGLLHSLNDKCKLIYNTKLALNFVMGANWRSFRNINSDITILSGPSLLPLVKYNNKTIALGHDLYFLDHKEGAFILKLYMNKMYKHFKEAPLIVVNSNFTKMEFVRKLNLNENKIFVLYPYINTELFHPGYSNIRKILKLSDEDVILLSVGGDNYNKNIETILRLMTSLPQNFKLIRVGRNFNTLGMIDKMNLSKRVIAFGNVDEKFLAELYRGSDIFLFPSLHEGFGIPLIEAMASGIPFITSNKASLPEVAGDAGVVCDPFDLEFMKETILQIIQDKKFKFEIVNKGLKRANNFSSENQYHSLYKIIDFFEG
jgi:glycosyltransferase involved in cell wall biosynthesis